MVEKLFLLLLAAQEGRSLVQRSQQSLIGEQGTKVPGQQLLLQRQANPGAGIANMRLDIRHGQHISAGASVW